MQLVPTILEQTPQAVVDQVHKLSPYFSTFQIDVVDGIFAPNKTPSVKDLLSVIDSVLPETKQQIIFDFHLMTADYEKEIDHIKALSNKITVRNILVHSDLSPNYHLLAMECPKFTFGAVLNSQDNVYEVMKNYDINSLPIIQFMTVHVGFQGNPFIDRVLKKIEQLKKEGFPGQIFLDGGINEETVSIVMSKKYRPDVLCIGSYITKTDKLEERVTFLKKNTISPPVISTNISEEKSSEA